MNSQGEENEGMEVPCVYRFVAKQRFIKKLQALLQPADHSVIAFVVVVHLFGFIVSPVFFKAKTFAKCIC